MAEINLTAAFSSVLGPDQESDERCGLTAELDGVKKEGVPLPLELDLLEDAQTGAGPRAQLKEALRLYFRRVMGQR